MSDRFQFEVFPSSGLPIYRQIMDQVRTQIVSGKLKAGDMLPSVRVAAKELEINAMTISKAYSELEREGVVERVRGHGMRVLTPQNKMNLQERKKELLPYLEQAAATAYQLGLTKEETLELLLPFLKNLKKKITGFWR